MANRTVTITLTGGHDCDNVDVKVDFDPPFDKTKKSDLSCPVAIATGVMIKAVRDHMTMEGSDGPEGED